MNDQTDIKRGRKYDQVIDGARQVFMADGFEGASVDTIARAACVSKATLYSYFPDKRLLFLEVARTECGRQSAAAIAKVDPGQTPHDVLTITGRHMLQFLLSEFGQRVFRICVAETDRFPELGHQFYASGPGLVEVELEAYFDEAVGRGELAIEDRRLAAHQFAELCKAELFPRLVFGMQTTFTEAEIERVVSGAVQTFLARYGA